LKKGPSVSLIANLTEVGVPDEIAVLDTANGLVLLADASKGVVWKVDVNTGAYDVAVRDNAFLIPEDALIPLGVDGIHILNDYLYFTNLASNTLGRIAIHSNGSARGSAETVGKMTFPDDFALAKDGTAYVAGDNSLYRVGANSTVDILAGGPNDPTLEGCTAARFGRTFLDHSVLYISTNGGILAPVNGRIHGGQILAVNVELFRG
jgi:hypothetical protein